MTMVANALRSEPFRPQGAEAVRMRRHARSDLRFNIRTVAVTRRTMSSDACHKRKGDSQKTSDRSMSQNGDMSHREPNPDRS